MEIGHQEWAGSQFSCRVVTCCRARSFIFWQKRDPPAASAQRTPDAELISEDREPPTTHSVRTLAAAADSTFPKNVTFQRTTIAQIWIVYNAIVNVFMATDMVTV